MQLIDEVFEVATASGAGSARSRRAASRLTPEYRDIRRRTAVSRSKRCRSLPNRATCISGQILQGLKKPHECSGVRQGLHAGTSAGRDDGLLGRGLRRLLPLWPLSPAGDGPVDAGHIRFHAITDQIEQLDG